MRVLLSAYACEPDRGSEPGQGWNWALQAARHHDVWVVTRANNRPVIERALASTPRPGLSFYYYDLPAWLRFWKRGGRGARLYYVLWQLGVLHEARRLHRVNAFDVVHHVTFNTMEVPGWLWLLGPPFVWGPVGGGQEPPPALRAYFGTRWYRERLRVLRKRLTRFNPLLRAAVRRAAAILVVNEETERKLVRLGAVHCRRELDTGVVLPPLDPARTSARSMHRFTVLWAGSLILRKGPRLALDVLAELKRRGVEFEALFVGGGPLSRSVKEWTRARGLEAQVVSLPEVSHRDMGRYYARSDVLLFSSLHDTSGNVVLEAMSYGLPVVTLDHQGVRDIVDAESGVKVSVRDQNQVVTDLAAALERLALDPALRNAMGQAARHRVGHVYSWAGKAELLKQIYAGVERRRVVSPGGASRQHPPTPGSRHD